MSRSLSSGTTFPSPYRLIEPTDRTLDGLPLWAAPWPCDMAAAPSGSPGCCPDPMPTTLTITLTSPSLVVTTYSLVWGEWNGGGVYFWQYSTTGAIAGNVVSRIDFYCLGTGGGYYPTFEAYVRFGEPFAGAIYFGPTSAVCCGAGISPDFIWGASNSVPSSGLPTGGGE